MTVLRYCERVQLFLSKCHVCPQQAMLHRVDRARASLAVTHALEGHDTVALKIAEAIAERWMLQP